MDSSIQLSSGRVFEISARLRVSPVFFAITTADSFPVSRDVELATSLLSTARHTTDHKQGAQKAWQAAETFIQCNEPERSLIALAVYAAHVGNLEPNAVPDADKLGVLVDTISLAHHALPYCQPRTTSELTQILDQLTEDACHISAFVDPILLTKGRGDIQRALGVAAVVWGPDLAGLVHDVERALNDLLLYIGSSSGADNKVQLYEQIIQDLKVLGQRAAGKNGGRRTTAIRFGIIQALLASWNEAAHNHLLRQNSKGQSNHEIQRPVSQAAEVETMIEQVETALRALLARKYRQQYGDGWPQHIEKNHSQMYSYWMHNMERDQATFRTYQSHKPELLEYARLEDLRELIAAQWHLFREILDFGRPDRNKAIFTEKMEQIAPIRNSLAHHRSIPENELLRAKVLCTDILLVLDKLKE
jgi:hypothetical protein